MTNNAVRKPKKKDRKEKKRMFEMLGVKDNILLSTHTPTKNKPTEKKLHQGNPFHPPYKNKKEKPIKSPFIQTSSSPLYIKTSTISICSTHIFSF